MNEDAAFTVFAAIMAGGIVIWLFALLLHRRVFRPADPADPQILSRGEITIEASVSEVREKTVATLRSGLPGIGPILLEEASEQRISGEITLVGGTSGASRRSPVGQSVRFLVDLDRHGPECSAKYWILGTGGGGCLKMASGLFVYLITPVVLAAAGFLVPTLIIGSEDPVVRYQVFQTLQIIHFLWPPFLFAGLRSRVANSVTRSLTDVLRNAAF